MKETAIADVAHRAHGPHWRRNHWRALFVERAKNGSIASARALDTMEEEIKRKITVQAGGFGFIQNALRQNHSPGFSVPGVDDFVGQTSGGDCLDSAHFD